MASLSPSGKTGVSILSHRFQAWPQPTCTKHSYRLNQCDHLICCLLSSFPRSYDLLPAYPSSRWWCSSVVVWAAGWHWGGETGPVCFSEASPMLQTGKRDAKLANACSASWCALPCCTAQQNPQACSCFINAMFALCFLLFRCGLLGWTLSFGEFSHYTVQ